MSRPDPTLATVFAQVLLDSLTSRERAEEAVQANRASTFCICCGGPKAGSRDYTQASQTFCPKCLTLLDADQRRRLRDCAGEQFLRAVAESIETITRRRVERGAAKAGRGRKAS